MSPSEQMILTAPTAPNVGITNFDLPSLPFIDLSEAIMTVDGFEHNNLVSKYSLAIGQHSLSQPACRLINLDNN